MMKRIPFAILGCGSVSGNRYFPNLGSLPQGELTAVCDMNEARAKSRSEELGVPYFTSYDELLEKANFELLVNLTPGPIHFSTSLKALQAGKHVYTQKPMCETVQQADILIAEAKQRNLKLVAEDSQPIQLLIRTLKKLIDEDVIGKVVWVRSFCSHGGLAVCDTYISDPTWFYQKGCGPLRDVGVERLHALTALIGPVKRVTAMSGINTPRVEITGANPFRGKIIDVTEDDVTLLTLDFGDSRFALLDTAWLPCAATRTPVLEIYGQKGVISQSEGEFSEKVELYRDEPQLGIRGWTDVKIIPPAAKEPPAPIIGLAHALDCILEDKRPIISGEWARHCIEVIEKAYVAARTGVTQSIESTF